MPYSELQDISAASVEKLRSLFENNALTNAIKARAATSSARQAANRQLHSSSEPELLGTITESHESPQSSALPSPATKRSSLMALVFPLVEDREEPPLRASTGSVPSSAIVALQQPAFKQAQQQASNPAAAAPAAPGAPAGGPPSTATVSLQPPQTVPAPRLEGAVTTSIEESRERFSDASSGHTSTETQIYHRHQGVTEEGERPRRKSTKIRARRPTAQITFTREEILAIKLMFSLLDQSGTACGCMELLRSLTASRRGQLH
jgi:hypothetical protein